MVKFISPVTNATWIYFELICFSSLLIFCLRALTLRCWWLFLPLVLLLCCVQFNTNCYLCYRFSCCYCHHLFEWFSGQFNVFSFEQWHNKQNNNNNNNKTNAGKNIKVKIFSTKKRRARKNRTNPTWWNIHCTFCLCFCSLFVILLFFFLPPYRWIACAFEHEFFFFVHSCIKYTFVCDFFPYR